MNLKDKYTAETGERAEYENVNFCWLPTPEYVQWLEAKYLELQSPFSDADYLKAREEIGDILIRLWKLEPKKADLMTCQILNGFEREGLRIMPKQKQSTAPEVSELIRRKFHGFSDEQWAVLKDTFPYSEIPFIIKEAFQTK